MKITTNQRTLDWLRGMLAAPDWKQHQDKEVAARRAYRSGVLLFDKIPEPKDKKVLDTAWCDTAVPEFDLSEKDAKICVECIKYWISVGKFPTDKYTNELLKIFDIQGSEE
jgi:hypothetical protein